MGFCVFSSCCLTIKIFNTVAHSEPCERVLAGSVVQTALLFRTTELSNIYCLVKVSVRKLRHQSAA